MEIKIEQTFRQTLPDVQVAFETPEEAEGYFSYAGTTFPVCMISKTILNETNITYFQMRIGEQTKLPELSLSFNDVNKQFRESDYIDENTDIIVVVGFPYGDPLPVRLSFEVVDVLTNEMNISIKAKLRLPKDKFTIVNDTIENMLKAFANTTKLGIAFNHDSYDQLDFRSNYVNVTAEQFLTRLFDDLELPWYIDGHYTVICKDIKLAISVHEEQECPIVLKSGEDLKKPHKVQFTNDAMNGNSQFMFSKWGYDFIRSQNPEVPPRQYVEFSKNAQVDLANLQVAENMPLRQTAKYDVSRLSMKLPLNPYMLAGTTQPVLVYTDKDNGGFVRGEENETDQSQKLIEDYTGVYLVMQSDYKMDKIGIKLYQDVTLCFTEPSAVSVDNPDAAVNDLSNKNYDALDEVPVGEQPTSSAVPATAGATPPPGELLSKYLSYKTFIYSDAARAKGINNEPTQAHLNAGKQIGYQVYDKIYEHFGGKVRINNMYRSHALNNAIAGSSKTSDHMEGAGMDLSALPPYTNKDIYVWLRQNVQFKQLIWEGGSNLNPDWVHIAYVPSNLKMQQLRMVRANGKVTYKPFDLKI